MTITELRTKRAKAWEAAKIQPKEVTPTGRKVDDLYERLNLLKH